MIAVQAEPILVIPNQQKRNILLNHSSQKKLAQMKYMTFEELIENLTIQPKKEAIYYLIKEFHYSYALARVYLENLKHITYVEKSDHEKVKKLLEIKKFLEQNHLLQDYKEFQNYIKGKQIRIEGYILTNEQKNILSQIEKDAYIEIIENRKASYTHPLYDFETINEEIAFIASDIANHLQNGVSINQICLTNVTSEYPIPLYRIFSMFGIPIEKQENHTLYGNPLVQEWLSYLKTEEDMEQTLEKMEGKFHTEEDQQIYTKLLQIYNDYVMVPKDEIWKICIEEACKQATISSLKYHDVVQIKDLKTTEFSKDEYVYIIGMNQENIPRIQQDEAYLNDSICKDLKMDTTLDKNRFEKEILIQKINAIPNATLTYKRKTPFGTYYPSSLITHLNVEKGIKNNLCYQYSDAWNKLELARYLDQYTQYNEKNGALDLLYAHYPNLSYSTYDNQYKPISIKKLRESLDGKLTLSYTSLDRFYRCQFRYYISNILKLDTYEETFAIKIGNLFHYFLSIAFQKEFNFEREWEKYHKDKVYNAKEKFFLKKLKQELIFVIHTIEEQNTYTELQQEEYEQKIFKSISGDLKITFMGIVDKIKYKEEDGIVYAAIIDYKTGTLETNLNQSIYGIGMQLPIYLYLLKNKPNWKSVKVVGFYLQKMIQNEMTNDEDKDYLQLKKDNMRLEGYSIDEEAILEKLDQTYRDSRLIKGIKVSSKGFYAYSKVMNETKMDKLSKLVENKIQSAAYQIENADFKINPKQIGSKLMGCEFCTYHDLCFQTSKDIEYLKEYKKLEFLEEDAL